jgi:hypothetical protein
MADESPSSPLGRRPLEDLAGAEALTDDELDVATDVDATGATA